MGGGEGERAGERRQDGGAGTGAGRTGYMVRQWDWEDVTQVRRKSQGDWN